MNRLERAEELAKNVPFAVDFDLDHPDYCGVNKRCLLYWGDGELKRVFWWVTDVARFLIEWSADWESYLNEVVMSFSRMMTEWYKDGCCDLDPSFIPHCDAVITEFVRYCNELIKEDEQ